MKVTINIQMTKEEAEELARVLDFVLGACYKNDCEPPKEISKLRYELREAGIE